VKGKVVMCERERESEKGKNSGHSCLYVVRECQVGAAAYERSRE
jgi:hypothetical protein